MKYLISTDILHADKEKDMNGSIKITVEKVKVEGNGVILLTGPSGCGKGEIAKALCKFLSIPEERHLSMGEILRKTIGSAKEDKSFRATLSEKYNISDEISIFDTLKNPSEVIKKAEKHLNEVTACFRLNNSFLSQFQWLEFCVLNGLLIPDFWTEKIIDALLENSPELHKGIFILDGYPRTAAAAEKLINTFNRLGISVIKVLHLFITKEQMKVRALARGRMDDTQDSLERRYQFYIEKVQPSIDYLKKNLGSAQVCLIDAHQPVAFENGQINVEASIKGVVMNVMESLGLPKYLMELKID